MEQMQYLKTEHKRTDFPRLPWSGETFRSLIKGYPSILKGGSISSFRGLDSTMEQLSYTAISGDVLAHINHRKKGRQTGLVSEDGQLTNADTLAPRCKILYYISLLPTTQVLLHWTRECLSMEQTLSWIHCLFRSRYQKLFYSSK